MAYFNNVADKMIDICKSLGLEKGIPGGVTSGYDRDAMLANPEKASPGSGSAPFLNSGKARPNSTYAKDFADKLASEYQRPKFDPDVGNTFKVPDKPQDFHYDNEDQDNFEDMEYLRNVSTVQPPKQPIKERGIVPLSDEDYGGIEKFKPPALQRQSIPKEVPIRDYYKSLHRQAVDICEDIVKAFIGE